MKNASKLYARFVVFDQDGEIMSDKRMSLDAAKSLFFQCVELYFTVGFNYAHHFVVLGEKNHILYRFDDLRRFENQSCFVDPIIKKLI